MTILSEALQRADCSITHLPDGSAVLVDFRNEALLTLNDSASFMLACLREGLDEAQVARRVTAHFVVDEVTAQADVHNFARVLGTALGIAS
ncbi:MAG TPA: PqqD family protein [Chiayiivirga sp.]|nr:PqqD family protein [Chiayiivirga sp.]